MVKLFMFTGVYLTFTPGRKIRKIASHIDLRQYMCIFIHSGTNSKIMQNDCQLMLCDSTM